MLLLAYIASGYGAVFFEQVPSDRMQPAWRCALDGEAPGQDIGCAGRRRAEQERDGITQRVRRQVRGRVVHARIGLSIGVNDGEVGTASGRRHLCFGGGRGRLREERGRRLMTRTSVCGGRGQVLLLMSVYDVPLTIPTMRAWKVFPRPRPHRPAPAARPEPRAASAWRIGCGPVRSSHRAGVRPVRARLGRPVIWRDGGAGAGRGRCCWGT